MHVIELRYSAWRLLWEAACRRFPSHTHRLRFPPKALHLRRPTDEFVARRGAGLERFMRELLTMER